MVERVVATEAAIGTIERLRARHGDLMFHQSGGCCDGSSPMCNPAGEFRTGAQDILLGSIAGAELFIARDQGALWAHTQLIIDVVPGRVAGFSLEAPDGVRFLTRRRVFTEAELADLASVPAPGGKSALRLPKDRGPGLRAIPDRPPSCRSSRNRCFPARRTIAR